MKVLVSRVVVVGIVLMLLAMIVFPLLSLARAQTSAEILAQANATLPIDPAPNPLTNPVIMLALGLATVAGVPGTLWLTDYLKDWFVDPGNPSSGLTRGWKMILGMACGLLVASGLALLHFFDAPALLEYPMWLRMVGFGLFFGATAGGLKNASKGGAG